MISTITPNIESPTYQVTNRLLENCKRLMERECYKEGFASLVQGLNTMYLSGDATTFTKHFQDFCLSHPVMEILIHEPMIKHCLEQPRGYAGDADLIDYFYRLKGCDKNTTYQGRELFNVASNNSSCGSVRWRARHLSELFTKISKERNKKISCLSVASGHIRELGYIREPENIFERFIALDQDNTSNNEAKKSLPYSFLSIIDESISYIIRDGFEGQEFDFVYSAGLFDYLNEKLAAKLIQKLYSNVVEGGVLLVPNFAKGILEQAYMDIFMNWKLIYRNEKDMLKLAELAGIPKEKVSLYRDPMCNVIYMRMEK